MILLAFQIILCLIAAFAVICKRHVNHNYFAGFVAWMWAGSMLSLAVGGIVAWPQALAGASLIKTLLCGISAGLAVYSGGNIFKVYRLLKYLVKRVSLSN